MSKYNFKVNLSPQETYELVKTHQRADLVHEEFIHLDSNQSIGTLIFEKYYIRSENRAALVVIIDNIKGYTDVRSISTGSSKGWLFNFDWGASDNFASSVKRILRSYIIDWFILIPFKYKVKNKYSGKPLYLFFISYTFSSLKAFIKDRIANIIININGKAAATDAVCKASNPPAINRAVANKDCTNPHNNFLLLDGSKSPSEVNIPKTNVAELADVIKKVHSNTIVTRDNMVPSG